MCSVTRRDIEGLLAVAHEFHLVLVEDAAESLGSTRGGRHTGTFGLMGTLSFNGNKTVTTGGGGAILTDDAALATRARHLTTTAKVPHRWEYRHDEVGYNYRMPNLNAALGCAQLEQLPVFLEAKRRLFERYPAAFADTAGVRLVAEPAGCRSNYWLQTLLLDEAGASDARCGSWRPPTTPDSDPPGMDADASPAGLRRLSAHAAAGRRVPRAPPHQSAEQRPSRRARRRREPRSRFCCSVPAGMRAPASTCIELEGRFRVAGVRRSRRRRSGARCSAIRCSAPRPTCAAACAVSTLHALVAVGSDRDARIRACDSVRAGRIAAATSCRSVVSPRALRFAARLARGRHDRHARGDRQCRRRGWGATASSTASR